MNPKTRVQEAAERAGDHGMGPPPIVYARLRRRHHESQDPAERARLKRALEEIAGDPSVAEHVEHVHREHEQQGIPR